MRHGRRLRSVLQFTVAGFVTSVFPVLVTVYAFSPPLYMRLRAFPTESWGSRADCLIALTSAGLLAIAIAGHVRLAPTRERIDRILYGFVGICLVALTARAGAGTVGDSLWSAGWFLGSLAWLALGVGFACESAVAQNELAQRVEEVETLHEVSWSLVGATSVGDLVQLFADALREKLDAEIVSIYLADPSGKSLELSAAAGHEDNLASPGTTYLIDSEDRRPGFHSGHTAKAFRSGEMQTADDVFVDVEFVPWRIIAQGDGRAVSLPLVDQQRSLGVLNVYFRDRRQATPQRLAVLQTVAAAGSPALGRIWTQMRLQGDLNRRQDLAA
jgi:hypothetical protein